MTTHKVKSIKVSKLTEMKKGYSLEGIYQATRDYERGFGITYESPQKNEVNTIKLLPLLKYPGKLIKESGKHGGNGVKKISTVLFLFATANTILFSHAISRLFNNGFEFYKVITAALVLTIGIGITIYSAYRAYQYVIIDTLRVIYENLSSFFIKISEYIIDKAEGIFEKEIDIYDHHLTKALEVDKIVHSKFLKSPGFLKKGIVAILNKIPLGEMLIDLKLDIISGNKTNASNELYLKMDRFISKSIFQNNNTNWVFWLLPLNIVLLLAIIKIMIG